MSLIEYVRRQGRIMSYQDLIKISVAADFLGVTVRTLRHYEDKGLIVVVRVAGRLWLDTNQLDRVREIRELQALGVPLIDMNGLLSTVEQTFKHTSHRTYGEFLTKHRNKLLEQRKRLMRQICLVEKKLSDFSSKRKTKSCDCRFHHDTHLDVAPS